MKAKADRTPKQKAKRHSEIQPNRSGGYIERLLNENGNFIPREKKNYPSDQLFFSRLKNIIEATAAVRAVRSVNIMAMYEAKLRIYNYNGEMLLYEIGVTKNQSTELL